MTSPSEPFVAVVGAGYWGKNLVRNFAALRALRAVCDANPEVLSGFEGKVSGVRLAPGFADTLRDPAVRAVVLATPAEQHYAMAREALLAGKDVFVEKPLALAVSEAEELVRLAAERSRVLMVGHLLEYHPAVVALHRLLDAGDLGKIQYVYSNRLNLGRFRTEENILWSFAPHDIAVILRLLGEMPERVAASGGNYLHHAIADVSVTTLAFPSGARGHIFVSWLHPYKEHRLVVVGDRKMAVFNDTAEDKLVLFAHEVAWVERRPVPQPARSERVPIDSVEPLRVECEHFLESVETRRTPRTDGESGLRVVRILEACETSLRAGGAPVAPVALGAQAAPTPEVFVHPTATVDPGARIGRGTKVWHYSHVMPDCDIGEGCNLGQNVVVMPGVRIGRNVKIQNNVSVYAGVTLEDDVFCGPSMVFTNVGTPRSAHPRRDRYEPTLVRRGATIGANATVVCGRTIGRYAFVGAGAVVTRDVPDHALVVGNPARALGWMCECGVRLRFEGSEAVCSACSAPYAKDGAGIRRAGRTG